MFADPRTTIAQERAADVSDDSTISSRLKAAKFALLSFEDDYGGYALRIYTQEQFKQNLDERRAYKAKEKEFLERRKPLDKRFFEAQQSGNGKEQRAIALELEVLDRERPRPHWSLRHSLHKVVSVGRDYIELEPAEDSDSTELIPLSRIHRIVFMKPTATDEPKEE